MTSFDRSVDVILCKSKLFHLGHLHIILTQLCNNNNDLCSYKILADVAIIRPDKVGFTVYRPTRIPLCEIPQNFFFHLRVRASFASVHVSAANTTIFPQSVIPSQNFEELRSVLIRKVCQHNSSHSGV